MLRLTRLHIQDKLHVAEDAKLRLEACEGVEGGGERDGTM